MKKKVQKEINRDPVNIGRERSEIEGINDENITKCDDGEGRDTKQKPVFPRV